MLNTKSVMTDVEVAEMGRRNQERAAKLAQQMGTKYVCHPSNRLQADPERANFKPADPLANLCKQVSALAHYARCK